MGVGFYHHPWCAIKVREAELPEERLKQMATFDDLFGKGSGSGKQFIKFENDGEAFLLEQTGEPKKVDQRGPKGGTIWLVQESEGDKYKPVEETKDFDESDYNNAFKPKNIAVPVKVIGKKLKDGSKDEGFEPFETLWELSTGDQEAKFKDAMLDAGVPVETGTKYVLKRLDSTKKPYTFSIKILTD